MNEPTVNIITYRPTTDSGRAELAMRVAQAHAEFVLKHVRDLDMPGERKSELIDRIAAMAKNQPTLE